MLWQIHLTPSNCSKTLWMLLPLPKKITARGWCTKFWDGLNRLQNSNELYHPLIWETTRNPFLASRLQCVSPYDPVRDRQVKHKNNQGAVEQKGCSLVSTMKSITSQRPKVTLQTWQKVFQKAAAAWLGANHLPLTFYLFIYPSILTIHPSIYWMFVYMYIFLPIMPICAHPAHPKKQAKSTNMEIM